MKNSSYKEEMGTNLTCLNDKSGISESDYLLRNTRELTPYVSQQFEGIAYRISVRVIHLHIVSRFQVSHRLPIYPESITLFVHECLPKESKLSSGK